MSKIRSNIGAITFLIGVFGGGILLPAEIVYPMYGEPWASISAAIVISASIFLSYLIGGRST